MNFTKPIKDIIKKRTSWRTYIDKPLEQDVKEKMINLMRHNDFGSPFNEQAGKARFELLSIPEFDPSEKKNLGTYGTIVGAQDFIVGAIEKSEYDREHFGYILESLILAATDLGLGTVWLGGTFNRSLFSAKIKKRDNESVPAITPIGYPAARTSKEITIRSYAKADKRFPWEKLFFEGDFSNPLKVDNEYFTLIENVRLGPSAGNFQPWRIIKEPTENNFHFYLLYADDKMGKVYNVFKRLDIGIAVCHFNLSAKELGISGKWSFEKPDISTSKDYSYIISWLGDNQFKDSEI
ncbi:MAG: nitroreductase family protein [Promethearchaeota archaeon]|jgi:nitroreductase